MDITGGGVDMGVTEQCLHHRQIDPGLGQCGAERMPQRVRVPSGDTGQLPVIAEDRPQPGRGQRLAPVRAFGHQKQTRRTRFGPFGEQIALNHAGHVRVERDRAFLGALAPDPDPAPPDIDIGDLERQHLA